MDIEYSLTYIFIAVLKLLFVLGLPLFVVVVVVVVVVASEILLNL